MSTRARRGAWLPFFVALPVYLALVWRFDYLCDDAFIFFRYAKNLAAGLGLRFNADEVVPVEGYSSLLWTLGLAGFAALGLELETWSRVASVAIGLAFFVHLIRFVRRRFELDTGATVVCALFLASFPPFALYSTSGMSELAYAFALYATFERLLGLPQRPRGVQAGACALLAALLRPEGALMALVVLGLGAATWWLTRSKPLARAVRAALVVLVAGVLVHVAWRYAYHGDFLGNTARTKGGISGARVLRGASYSATWFAVFPGMAFAMLAPLFGAAREHGAVRLQSWGMVAASLGFATAVGGDFMPMGRFLLAATPFALLLLASWLAHPRASNAKLCAALAAGAASLLPAFDRHLAPLALREAVGFRAEYFSEYVSWRAARDNCRSWIVLGRALRDHTRPGESLIFPFVGAVGFYSDLHVHDQFGLVTRASDVAFVWALDTGDPGHDRFAPAASFLGLRPTYLDARLVPHGFVEARQWTQSGPWSAITKASYHALGEPLPGLGDLDLELVRFTSWEWIGTPFLTLVDLVRKSDPRDPKRALARIAERERADAGRLERAEAEIRELASTGRLFDGVEPFGVRQISRLGDRDTLGYQVFVWYLASDGPVLEAPNGAIVRSLALAGEPRLDGVPPGWSVVTPGSVQELSVDGGVMLVVSIRLPPPPPR